MGLIERAKAVDWTGLGQAAAEGWVEAWTRHPQLCLVTLAAVLFWCWIIGDRRPRAEREASWRALWAVGATAFAGGLVFVALAWR